MESGASLFYMSQCSHLYNGWNNLQGSEATDILSLPTHQLSLLSSGQGEPVPLPAALCHLRRICRRRRPVVHAKRHQLPPTPDTLPLQRKASSRRARAVGPPGNLRGGGGGVKTYPLFPLVHPGSILAEAFPVLFFPFARRDGCGERKK